MSPSLTTSHKLNEFYLIAVGKFDLWPFVHLNNLAIHFGNHGFFSDTQLPDQFFQSGLFSQLFIFAINHNFQVKPRSALITHLSPTPACFQGLVLNWRNISKILDSSSFSSELFSMFKNRFIAIRVMAAPLSRLSCAFSCSKTCV